MRLTIVLLIFFSSHWCCSQPPIKRVIGPEPERTFRYIPGFPNIFNMTGIPQSQLLSCWAASLAMVGRAYNYDSTYSECCIIDKNPTSRHSETTSSVCSCGNNLISKNAYTVLDPQLMDLTQGLFEKHFPKGTGETISHNYIRSLLTSNQPIIFRYRYGSKQNSHIVLFTGYQTQTFGNKKKTSFVKVLDPWPTRKGLEYYMTYERYKEQPESRINETGMQSGKYSVYFSPISYSKDIRADNKYLSDIFKGESEETLIKDWLWSVGQRNDSNMTLDSSFFKTINLPHIQIKNTQILYNLKVVSVSIQNQIDLAKREISIRDILSDEFYERFILLGTPGKDCQDSTVTTVSSVSKIKSPEHGPSVTWIIGHLENGKKYDQVIKSAKCTLKNEDRNPGNWKALEPVAILYMDKFDDFFLLFNDVVNKDSFFLKSIYGNRPEHADMKITELNAFLTNK